ncbi:uncharacterized protein I303_107719 [Kwoniella dejecticola CBS 10117]|uniref:PH domain-containing protein n=1 Tax=Kwoniella dejecticola CBS 10117 TaxID=1296121 RepID=A0AAJ8KX92_9TREE
MPSPPLSPTPRRWRSSPDQPHPDFAALLSSFEQPTPSSPNSPKPKSENESLPEWATPRGILSEEEDQKDEDEVEFLTATASTSGPNPEIRTTSPSPQRPAATSRAAELGLDSPLLPPNRGRLFGEDYSKTVNQLGSRGIFANEPRLNAPAEFPFPITTQTTGQSTATIDAAYDGVLSQLDALANPSTSRLPPASGSSSNPYLPPSNFQPMPIRQPLVGLGINMNSSSSLSQPTSPGLGNFTLSRLSTVTERTEKSSSPTSERSNTHSHTLSPTFPGAYKEGPSKTHSASASTIAGKYPLPPSPSKVPSSPIKGPRSAFSTAPTGTVGTSASGTPQGTPQKASDLIKMFESKGDSPNVPPQPKFLPSSPTKPIASKPTSTSTSTKVSGLPSSGNTHPDTTFNTPSAPPSSYRTPLTSTFEIDAPTPPPKSPSPLSQVRGMIASWRARSGSPSQRVVGPVSGGPGLFRSGTGDKGWNVSIRRRRRNEKELAEQADEATEEEKKAPSQHSEEDKKSEKSSIHDEKAGEEPRSRSGSLRSDKKSSEPKQLTGDPIRTGALYFLNVHDEDDKPNFKWVRADGRLYPEGLELTWISGKGKATVTLDLEFCDEVASTYSPNNPMAGDDIGAAAARRQGQLADSLYPFKLVYDDGVERLACDSARDRVRWVNAIWTVLKRTRAAPSASLRANRSSSDHGSEAGGSASTHFTPAEVIQPLPSSPLPSSTGSHPLYTTDDAVIETSGGFHAPIVQRDSRKLAAGGLERIRSLRRVASEADLKEVSAPPLPGKDVPLSPRTTGMLDVPLTAQNAERPRSRDFTFAHGIKPPTLKSEGSPSEIFQTPGTGFQSLGGTTSRYDTATPGTITQGLSSPSRFTNARSEIAPTPTSTQFPPSVYTMGRSGLQSASSPRTAQSGQIATASGYQSALEPSSGQSMYTAQTPAGTIQAGSERAWTAQPGSSAPAASSRGAPSSPSMYTAQPGSATIAGSTRDLPSSPSLYTAQPGSFTPTANTAQQGFSTPAASARDMPTTDSMYTPQRSSQVPMSTAQQWSATSPYTAKEPTSEQVTAEIFSPTASSYTARPGTQAQTPAATVRGMSTPSSHTAMQGESASPPMGTAPPFSSDSDRTAVMPPATSTAMGTAQPFSVTSDWTARHPSTASTPMGTANQFSGTFSGNTAPTPAGTAQPWTSSASVHTPRGPSPSAAIPFTPTGVPQVAVTGASPSGPSSETAHSPYGYHGTPSLSAASERNGSSSTGSTSQRNPALMVPGSPGSPSNTPVPSDRASSRMSRNSGASTYQTAPPPVPSRDSHYSSTSPSKASSKASSPIPSPTRYSLHDAPVPSFAESVKTPSAYPTATQGDSYFTAQHPTAPTDYGTAQLGDDLSSYHERPPTTRYATATTDLRTGSAGTAPTSPSRSPRSSEYDTAPPPPIFRTASSEAGQSSTDRLTDGLTSRRGSRAWTQVSHPDSDDELLVDLERRSSNSSSVSRRTKSKYAITNYSTVQTPSRTMHTAQTFDRSARTPLGTARENTMYTGARDSAYTTATGWQTLPSNYATAPPAQSWYTARTSQTAPTIRGEVPPPLPSTHPAETVVEQQSVSTASTIPSRRIPRVPPPPIALPVMQRDSSPQPTAAPSPAQPAPEVRYLPPPSPSFPSSVPGSSDSSTTAVSSTEATTRDVATGTDVNRLLNYLQGQDQARQGQTTRVGNQLDRIERRVNQIAENQSALAERDGPPPVPAKDDDESPPPSPSSATSSTSTARPVTPPPLIIPEVINQQFDDLRNLLGTLIGRQEDLLGRQDEMAQEMNRRRSYDVELPDRGPGMARLEDLLKRVLQRVGDSEFADDFEPSPKKKGLYPIPPMATPKSEGTRDGSMYEGGDSIYGSEFGARGRGAPANSIASSFDRRRRRPISEISSSLIDGEIPEPEFDEEFALSGLPPDTPPEEFISRQPQFPRHLVGQQRPRAAPTPQQQYIPPQPVPPPEPIQEYPEEEEYYDERPEQEPSPQPEPVYEPSPEPAYQPQPIPEQPATEYEPTPPPVQQREMTPDQPPIPFRSHDDYQDDNGQYQDDALQRGPYQPGPPPQPVDLPTPVNSPRNMPPYSGQQTGMRPGFAPAGMPAPPIPGPAMTDMPRPSLPRIAGVRDPISTTYYRRGFPPGPMGPMGPMGMFPGPMGIPGPGMGPFMPGLRPGMPGFGGPIGPNVNPSLRRNGFFPPGVNSTTGDYGLPAAARYGNSGLPPSGPTVMGQPRPPTGSGNTTTADTGLGNTTTESTVTTPSVTSMATEEILTPIAPTTGLQEPLHMPTGPMATAELPPIPLSASHIGTDDSFRRALGNNQALAAAQGEQQNEMSRYLHGMSDQIADGTLATQNQLAEILGDIAVLREQLKPKHVHARVLPDGTVMLDNGDIVDGIRGAPAPVPPGAPPPPPPPASASHVEGHILPDGTVMVGGKVVDGIKGAPSVAEPGTPMMELNERIEETVKNQQQDAKLAELQDKIEELMAKTAVPPPVSAPPPAERIYEEEEIISARADSGTDANGLTPGLIPTTIGDATPLPTPAPAMTSAGTPIPALTSIGTPAPTIGVVPTTVGPNTDIRREKQVIKEREVIREGPVGGRHKEVTVVDEIEKDMVTTVPPGSLPAGSMPPGSVPLVTATLPPGSAAPPGSVVPPGTVLAEEENVAVTAVPTAPGSGGAAASGTSHTPPPTVSLPIAVPTAVPTAAPPGTAPPPLTRLNPRTGKPLTIPPALSAHSISPIQTDYDPNPPAPSHLIREEHEEIIQHPASGGPPIHTHTTTRTYTQAPAGTAPAGSVPPATIMGDQPVTAVPPTVGPSASVHPSAGKAATVAPPAVSVVPSASGAPDMPVIASGAHTSDHQATVQQAPPNIATVKSAHESETVAPGPVPIDSKNASTSHTVHPGVTVADPSVVVPPPPASVAPAPPPQTASNVPSGASKPAWDGNHAKSPKPSKAASLANVPSEKPASVANVPSGPPSGAPPPPASAANVPATPAPPSVAPDAPAGKLPPASAADAPAAPPPASSGKGSGVHWDPMIPAKEVATTPPKSPKSPKSKPASIVEPPQATAANIPSGPPAAEIHNVPSAPEPTVPTEHVPTGHEVPIVRPGSADTKVQETHKSPSSLGGILKKPKSKESLKETTTTPAGVPLVPADTRTHSDHTTVGKPVPTHGSDKGTRVADTAHVSHLPTLEELAMEGRDLTVHPPGDTVHVPSHPAASSGSNKLRKKPPTFAEGSTADPANMANIPVPPSRAGTPAGSMKGATPVPMTMEEVVLPDGRTAYIPSRPASQAAAPLPADTGIPPPLADRPSTGKKGKSTASDEKDKEKVTSSSPPQKDTTHTGIPAESEVGRGHCSVCCPNGPRAVAGVPIEPCEHQGGILGQAAKQHSAPTGPRTNKSASQKLSKTPPNQPGSLGLPEAENVGGPGQEVDMGDVVGPPPTGPKPSSKGGKSQKSNPEEAMEDARKLAAKQKAAAEQAALEAAERDARLKDKEAKAKIAEERHRQNVEALANLQKALDLIAADGKATKTVNDEKAKAQEKRRTDKTARDKKITEALDKIVADREEEKKKAAANDKKPGTQAILDALKNKGDAESAFLRKLSTEIMEQNSNQHTLTQQAVKAAAREQVGFNLAGYLDDFSKALSGEVRVLLKEVGDLRESRRALYMELAELLLIKGRQSAGDLMAVLPYPAAPPKNPANQPKPAEKKDGGGGNQQQGQGKGKAPAGVPAWATWHPMMPPVMGRPLPQPGGPPPMSMNMSAGMVPPPPMGGKPLPQV